MRHHNAHMEAKEQLAEASFLLALHGFRRLNSSAQAWQQVPLHGEPFPQSSFYFFIKTPLRRLDMKDPPNFAC